MFAFNAAGFIATSTLGTSPGVTMSWSEMCTWNDDTPAIVPAGARISAGKFGSVARSLPNAARQSVKRSPTSCMPSPESPAKRITTWSSVSRLLRVRAWCLRSPLTSLCRLLCGRRCRQRVRSYDGVARFRVQRTVRHAPSRCRTGHSAPSRSPVDARA